MSAVAGEAAAEERVMNAVDGATGVVIGGNVIGGDR